MATPPPSSSSLGGPRLGAPSAAMAGTSSVSQQSRHRALCDQTLPWVPQATRQWALFGQPLPWKPPCPRRPQQSRQAVRRQCAGRTRWLTRSRGARQRRGGSRCETLAPKRPGGSRPWLPRDAAAAPLSWEALVRPAGYVCGAVPGAACLPAALSAPAGGQFCRPPPAGCVVSGLFSPPAEDRGPCRCCPKAPRCHWVEHGRVARADRYAPGAEARGLCAVLSPPLRLHRGIERPSRLQRCATGARGRARELPAFVPWEGSCARVPAPSSSASPAPGPPAPGRAVIGPDPVRGLLVARHRACLRGRCFQQGIRAVR